VAVTPAYDDPWGLRTRFEVRDASGALVAVHERDDSGTDKRFYWRQPGGTLGLAGVPASDLPLYGIDRLTSHTVVVAEGEKATDALLAAGVPAVGTVTGASGTPSARVLADLAGKRAVLWPDADEVGKAHMERVGAGLRGVAVALYQVDWPDAPPHGDAADLPAHQIRELVDSAIEQGKDQSRTGSAEARPWPEPLGDAAYHGVLGDLVHAVEAHTEADPAALLTTMLAVFGALAGDARTLYQGQLQKANLFVVLVGDTSSGRKGTSLSVAREIFTAANAALDDILVPGLGSGEALPGHLRRNEPKGERRALVIESEFGRLLRVMAREGSTVSPIMRDAWDGVPLGRVLARESDIVARHHVACLGHITPQELRERLSEVEAANGFGNRFLFFAVRRSRFVPFPRAVAHVIDPSSTDNLAKSLEWAQTPGELLLSPSAMSRWEALYVDLANRQVPALLGALTRRAEAQIARLALLYALLDRSALVDLHHLEAGEAVWSFAARSARHIFGESTGNRHADVALKVLRAEGEIDRQTLKSETGLRLGADLDAVESTLVDAGLAELVTVPRSGGGRPQRLLRLPKSANGANGQ
jgi:hypothetical protein